MPYQHTVVDPSGDAVIVVHTTLILLEHAIFVKDEQRTLTVRIVIIIGIAILTGDIDFGIFRIRTVAGQQICGRIRYANHSGDDISVAVEIVERVSDVIPTSSVHNAVLIICCALITGKPSIELQDAVTVKRILALREQSIGFAQIIGSVGFQCGIGIHIDHAAVRHSDQTKVILDIIIYIVDQHTVAIQRQNTVFDNHSTLCIKLSLITGFDNTICFGDPCLSVLDCFQICIDVIEIPIITIDKSSINCHAIFIKEDNIACTESTGDVGQIAAQLVQSRLDNQCALCIKQIVISTLTAIASRNLTKPGEGIAVVAKEIAFAIYRPPFSGDRLSGPVITTTGTDRDPVSSHQNMTREGIVQVFGVLLAIFGDHRAYCLSTVNRLECSRIKIIILTASIGCFDLTPAVLGLAVDGIVQIILVGKQSGYLSDRDAI